MTGLMDIDRLVARSVTAAWAGAPVVGFCGAAGAGKTTAADYLCKRWGFARVRFAGPLKDMLMSLGLTVAEVDGTEKEKPCALLGGKTPRQAMQWLGTEWGRMLVDPDLWLRAWAHQADARLANGVPVAVDDVRFANEAAAIRARGGLVIRIVSAIELPKPPAHISETIGFAWDAEVVNPGAGIAAFHTSIARTVAEK